MLHTSCKSTLKNVLASRHEYFHSADTGSGHTSASAARGQAEHRNLYAPTQLTVDVKVTDRT